ncbi:ribonuclease E activity regulator RraA [Halorhodospira halophila]|uniref:Putative 4-hydroxy-4-methyl-2-oxoglutarate aldolase n=1 Tax=Halorhodospira halophila (strain DSM 244 / SL1) TaxID=349124 RepID=RRAAH_HALHL|nr:ribonuclease E activity regulator RraA [Halorhodospira halophila]A1WU91.1 RecName: Full=Putative 4-hydroxy-4-methyl-2-oxoglutarate aldolase; Short=HMG aldolase; AltName: Full=Oxaloacetate decarboxylase; Short=OAA decarboxylase; AltName: Full=Regulator of ribonuclease activity homolog; AltName: Full=RraA-like protein [Halorhodospira halophila SL1]ABM61253.1 regulator of ribonuclease activity A [Halorhodospira halophila SL1]MBK1730015.1 ribonuclease activity regulator protein RraA [Halorhodospi
MALLTTDLCDAYADEPGAQLRAMNPMLIGYGGRARFGGPVTTLKLFEDNVRVRELLSAPGDGGVLVVDGGGSMRCALLGDRLAELGRENGWSGAIIYGCVRDSAELAQIDFGVQALNTHPLKSQKKGLGERDVSVTFAGVTIQSGDWLYADEDGVVVASRELTL